MRFRTKLSIWGLLMVLVVGLGFSTIPQPVKSAKFVLATWDYPADEYGQGIDKITVYHNSTGSWTPVVTRYYYDSHALEWNASDFIKLIVWTWFNSTLTGSSDWIEGKNHHRHNVTVLDSNNVQIFSQQNFTFDSAFPAIDPPLWYYGYEVVLNFLPLPGEIYTAVLEYGIYWGPLP